MRVNVSKGPRPIAVPNVVGQPYESAASTLFGAGFAVVREDVEDDAAEGIVVAPGSGPELAPGPGRDDHAAGLAGARRPPRSRT